MRRSNLIHSLLTVAFFIFLETISIIMVSRNGIIQRYRIVGSLRSIQTSLWRSRENVSYFINYRTENERLAAENLTLKQELDSARAILGFIEDSLTIDTPQGFTYISATVVKNSTHLQHNNLLLNKGYAEGISEGMGVITANGVVGIVNSVSKHYSHVISFLSEGQSVSAKLKNDGTFGPMVWEGKSPHEALLYEIPAHTDINVGDTILSSGYSIIYPSDIPLGVVKETSTDGVSIKVDVSLFQNFKSLRHVYIVKNNNYREIKELEDGK